MLGMQVRMFHSIRIGLYCVAKQQTLLFIEQGTRPIIKSVEHNEVNEVFKTLSKYPKHSNTHSFHPSFKYITLISHLYHILQRLHQDHLDDILSQFEQKGITSVFNLTEPGEHPFCGHELLPSCGFSYDPEALMSRGIRHFNYNWPDMTAPSIAMIMDVVCHASYVWSYIGVCVCYVCL
jgi:hypothetical protein